MEASFESPTRSWNVTEGAALWKMNKKEIWYVIYTKSRQEKILNDKLMSAGYSVYLPLVKKNSQWSDRRKIIEVPLFNSYLFIKNVSDREKLKDFNGFVNFLMFDNKPAIVTQTEIETLKSIIRHGYDVLEITNLKDLKLGSKVMVIGGPLKGMVGELISNSDEEWFLINFENFSSSIQVKIPPKVLKKI